MPTTHQFSSKFPESSTLKRNLTEAPGSTTTATLSPVNALPLTGFNSSLGLGAVSGNPETNEIEAVAPAKDSVASTHNVETSTRPSLVTWSIVDVQNTTKPSIGTGA